MRQRTIAAAVVVVALGALIAGCAGRTAGAGPDVSTAPAADLVGTWNGLFWWPGGTYWQDEGTMLPQIKEDGTFTVKMTPAAAANNLAKPSSWSGTVSESGKLVVFHLVHGGFPAFSSLARSGDDTLFAVANDPATGMDIDMEFERAGGGTAGGKTSGGGTL
jgi:predicted small secreted protein